MIYDFGFMISAAFVMLSDSGASLLANEALSLAKQRHALIHAAFLRYKERE